MGVFNATAGYTADLGSSIQSFEVTFTVPSNPPSTGTDVGQIDYWWMGLETQDSNVLLQPVIGYEGGKWYVFDAFIPPVPAGSSSFNTSGFNEVTDIAETNGGIANLGIPVQPGTTLTMKVTELADGSYEATIPGYTSGLIEKPPTPFTQAILALETYGVTKGDQLGSGVTFSDIQIQQKDAQGVVTTPTPTWTVITDGQFGTHAVTSPTQVQFITQDGNTPVIPLPHAPVIENFSPSQESVDLTKFIIMAGQAHTGDEVTLYDGTNKLGSMLVTNGLWSLSESGLQNGIHNFTAVDTSAHGITTSQPLQLDVETVGHTPVPHVL